MLMIIIYLSTLLCSTTLLKSLFGPVGKSTKFTHKSVYSLADITHNASQQLGDITICRLINRSHTASPVATKYLYVLLRLSQMQ